MRQLPGHSEHLGEVFPPEHFQVTAARGEKGAAWDIVVVASRIDNLAEHPELARLVAPGQVGNSLVDEAVEVAFGTGVVSDQRCGVTLLAAPSEQELFAEPLATVADSLAPPAFASPGQSS